MPTTTPVPVEKLKLDLANFRTVPQTNEADAIHAIVSINPDWFWALTESLLTDGYHATENIIVVKDGTKTQEMVVKEGNRRIGALKLALGYVPQSHLEVPSHIEKAIRELSSEWKVVNQNVPCAIYEQTEAEFVDKLVTLIHGKGEKAGRDKWNAIAKARHNRDKGGASEPGLNLLEKYLKHGQNITPDQAERWSGDYPLTVLDEAMKRLAGRFGAATARELADKYPLAISNRAVLERILSDVGLEALTFKIIRQAEDFGQTNYGLTAPTQRSGGAAIGAGTGSIGTPSITGAGSASQPQATGGNKIKAVSLNDPKSVIRTLRKFHPKGSNRGKLVTLLDEARKLKLDKHPHAFCFLLRSMFEISAKAYCADHASTGGPTATKQNGEDRKLVEILRDITKHLTNDKGDKVMTKTLHGAMAELGKSEGILSVTSMNQLVHNPAFSVDETHISTLFGNVFPLLEAMNR